MLAATSLTLALTLGAGACSVNPEVICEGTTPACDTPGYYALCNDPGENDAVRESDGLFCVNRENCTPSTGDFCLDYIGPAIELPPDCTGGQPAACPGGEQPQCVFLPGCRGEELAP